VFGRFAHWCRQAAGCPLVDRDTREVYDRVIARAERRPLPAAPSPRVVQESEIHRVMLSRLGSPEEWPHAGRCHRERRKRRRLAVPGAG
jgi:hypothetical protein